MTDRPIRNAPPSLTPQERTNFESNGGPRLGDSAGSTHPFDLPSKRFPPKAADPPKPPTTRQPGIIDRLLEDALKATETKTIEQERIDTSPYTVIESRQRETPTAPVDPVNGGIVILLILAIVTKLRRRESK